MGCTPLAKAASGMEAVAELHFKGGAGRTVETKGGETARHGHAMLPQHAAEMETIWRRD